MDKIGNGSSQSNQKSTQAYKLFSEGKKPVEVAIQLGLSERQATKHYREYWELKGLHELTFLYEERKDHLPSMSALLVKSTHAYNQQSHIKGYVD